MGPIAAAPSVRWRSEAKEYGGFYTFLKSEVAKLKAAEGNMRTHAMKQCDVLLKEYVSFNPYIQRLYFEHQRNKKHGDSRYPQAYRYSVPRLRFPSVWDSCRKPITFRDNNSKISGSSARSESTSDYPESGEQTSARIRARTPKPERGRNKSPEAAHRMSPESSRNPEREGTRNRSPELIRYRSPESNPERPYRRLDPYRKPDSANEFRITDSAPYKKFESSPYKVVSSRGTAYKVSDYASSGSGSPYTESEGRTYRSEGVAQGTPTSDGRHYGRIEVGESIPYSEARPYRSEGVADITSEGRAPGRSQFVKSETGVPESIALEARPYRISEGSPDQRSESSPHRIPERSSERSPHRGTSEETLESISKRYQYITPEGGSALEGSHYREPERGSGSSPYRSEAKVSRGISEVVPYIMPEDSSFRSSAGSPYRSEAYAGTRPASEGATRLISQKSLYKSSGGVTRPVPEGYRTSGISGDVQYMMPMDGSYRTSAEGSPYRSEAYGGTRPASEGSANGATRPIFQKSPYKSSGGVTRPVPEGYRTSGVSADVQYIMPMAGSFRTSAEGSEVYGGTRPEGSAYGVVRSVSQGGPYRTSESARPVSEGYRTAGISEDLEYRMPKDSSFRTSAGVSQGSWQGDSRHVSEDSPYQPAHVVTRPVSEGRAPGGPYSEGVSQGISKHQVAAGSSEHIPKFSPYKSDSSRVLDNRYYESEIPEASPYQVPEGSSSRGDSYQGVSRNLAEDSLQGYKMLEGQIYKYGKPEGDAYRPDSERSFEPGGLYRAADGNRYEDSPSRLPSGGIYPYKVPGAKSYRTPDLSYKLPEARLSAGNVYIIRDGNYRTSESRTIEHFQVGNLQGNQIRTPEPERSRMKTPEDGNGVRKRKPKFPRHKCDVEELAPEPRRIRRKSIPNKVPETRKYTFYKYYGFAGQGAKTSWAHNRPLGLAPPHAKRGPPQLEEEDLVQL